MNARALLVPVALGALLLGCGPFEGYRVRTEARIDDAKLTDGGRSVDVLPIALGPGFRAAGQTSGKPADQVKATWSDVAKDFNQALGEASTPELRLVLGGTGSRYALQPEIVLAESTGDVWFGYTTDVGVLCTLWDRQANRVVDRFTVLSTVPGEWRVRGADGVFAHSVAAYLAARFLGRELDSKVTP